MRGVLGEEAPPSFDGDSVVSLLGVLGKVAPDESLGGDGGREQDSDESNEEGGSSGEASHLYLYAVGI